MSSEATVEFSFFKKQEQTRTPTFWDRYTHFQRVVDPKLFLKSDEQVKNSLDLVQKYKQLEKDSQGPLRITSEQKKEIQQAQVLVSSAVNPDSGEIIPKCMRLCSFIYFNLPIVGGLLLGPPTAYNVMFWQFCNQSYNAAINFGNRNASSKFTQEDLIKGYSMAVGSSMVIGAALRSLMSGLSKSSSGAKLVLINSLIASISGGSAIFLNTYCMRRLEIENGIEVYQDEQLTKKAGISKIAAKQAVFETGISRVFLTFACLMSPSLSLMCFEKMNMIPKHRVARIGFEQVLFFASLFFMLPASVAIFPQTKEYSTKYIEKDLQEQLGSGKEYIYFNKGM